MRHDDTWENHFGKRLEVRDHWKELRLTVQEQDRTFGLVVRAYDDGVRSATTCRKLPSSAISC